MEVSAKTGKGIDKIFTKMVEELLKLKNVGLIKDDDPEIDKTFTSLNNSTKARNRHNCNC